MAADLETLIAPVDGDSPVGPDLSYDPEREQIELAFASSVSADSDGGSKDWRETIALIESQSTRTKDLWLAVYLARAAARAGDFERIVLGTRCLAGLLENYWDEVHPQLEEYGFQGRKTPCESLASVGEFLRHLDKVPLVRHQRFGEFTAQDFLRFAANGGEEDGYGVFRAALEDLFAKLAAGADDAIDPIAAVIDGLDAMRDAIRRADATLMANAGDEGGANFAPTYEAIEALRRAVASFGPVTEAADVAHGGDGYASDSGDRGSASGGGGGKAGGRVDSRDDVLRSIDAIVDYYRRREPGSPLPVLLGRARDWVNADFLTIMEDIAPGGVEDVRRVLTSQRVVEE